MIIYKISNSFNSKVYIGQTIRPLNERISEYKRLKIYNNHLKLAFKKYGFENFKFEIVDSTTSIHDLNEKEIYWIKHYESTNKLKGYNIMEGGRNSSIATETKEKMRTSHLGKKQNESWIINRIPKAGSDDAKKYGRPRTEEEKENISKNHAKYWLNKERDQLTKDKISKTKQGQLPSNCKPVFKLNITTKDVIAQYKSTFEASRENPNFSQSKISRICNGKAKSKENFTFSFTSNG
jgi:group I intron endonuclease